MRNSNENTACVSVWVRQHQAHAASCLKNKQTKRSYFKVSSARQHVSQRLLLIKLFTVWGHNATLNICLGTAWTRLKLSQRHGEVWAPPIHRETESNTNIFGSSLRYDHGLGSHVNSFQSVNTCGSSSVSVWKQTPSTCCVFRVNKVFLRERRWRAVLFTLQAIKQPVATN